MSDPSSLRVRIVPASRLAALAVALMVVAAGAQAQQATAPRDQPASPAERAQIILHMLDYVGVDYPGAVKDGKVLDQGEYDEQVEFVVQARSLIGQLEARPERAALAADADRLIGLVKDKRPGDEVAALATRLRWADHQGVRRRGGAQAAARSRAGGRALRRAVRRCATAPRGGATGRRARASTLRPRISTMASAWRSEASTASTAPSRSASAERAWRAFAGSPTSSAGRSPSTWRTSARRTADTRRGAELWQAGAGQAGLPGSGEHRHAERARGARAARRRRGDSARVSAAASGRPRRRRAARPSPEARRSCARASRHIGRGAGGTRRSWRRRATSTASSSPRPASTRWTVACAARSRRR